MLSIYNNRSETIETVYTYKEWLKEYNRQETKQKLRKKRKEEHIYYMKQRLSGLIMAVIGIAAMISFKDATFSLFAVPLGIFLLLTKEKVMTF